MHKQITVLLVAVWQKKDGGIKKQFLFHDRSCNITQQLIKTN